MAEQAAYRRTLSLVFGHVVRDAEEQLVSAQLIAFLERSVGSSEMVHIWLQRFQHELIVPWRRIARYSDQDWDVCSGMITNTDPASDLDMPLAHFAGRVEGSGRLTLSTLHSAKGREFNAVVMYGVNVSDLPNDRDQRSAASLREARRLFYVGVTRPRKELSLIFQEYHHSPLVAELYQRSERR